MGKRKIFLLIFLLCTAAPAILPDSSPDKNQLQLEPENPEAYLEAGRIYRELEDEKKASFYFTKYVSLGGSEDKVKEIR